MQLNLLAFIGFIAICSSHVYFKEDFSDPNWESRWVVSDWKQDKGEAGAWDLSTGKFFTDGAKERGLKTTQDARFYDISAKHEEFSNKGKTLVIQLSVKHEQNIDCGGGYVKLVPASALTDQKEFQGGEKETQYNVMFGPDICGYSTKKVHFILNKRGSNHLIKDDVGIEKDEFTHVYTGVLSPDNTFKIYVDGAEKKSGSIPDHWDILPPKKSTILIKANLPTGLTKKWWMTRKTKKPEGWDDIPSEISDPDATKPDDWDDDLDGEWEAPKIPNPEYKGAWSPKKIENPNYKGPWVHPQIDNPEYKEDPELYAFESFKYLGIDIWQVKSGSIFSHFLLTDDWEVAQAEIDKINEIREGEKKKKEEADAKEKAEREAAEAEKKAAEAAAEAEKEDEGEEEEVKEGDKPEL